MEQKPKKVSDLVKVLENNLSRSPSPGHVNRVPAIGVGLVPQPNNSTVTDGHKNVPKNSQFYDNNSNKTSTQSDSGSRNDAKSVGLGPFSYLNKPVPDNSHKKTDSKRKTQTLDTSECQIAHNLNVLEGQKPAASKNSSILKPKLGLSATFRTKPKPPPKIFLPPDLHQQQKPKMIPSPFLVAKKLEYEESDRFLTNGRFSFDNFETNSNNSDEIAKENLTETVEICSSGAAESRIEPPPVPPKPRRWSEARKIERRYSWPVTDMDLDYQFPYPLPSELTSPRHLAVFKDDDGPTSSSGDLPDWTARLRSRFLTSHGADGRRPSPSGGSSRGGGQWSSASSKRAKKAARFAKRSFVTSSGDFSVYFSQHFIPRVQSITSTGSQPSSLYSLSGSDLDEAGGNNWTGGEKSFSKLYHAANEFYTSEKQYVKILETLAEELPSFIDKESKKLRRTLILPELCKSLSVNLLPLLTLHKNLRDSFEKAISKWNADNPGIAKILNEIGPFIKMSSQFLRVKSSLVQQIIDNCKRNFDFNAVVKEFEKQKFNGLFITHQFDCVHQRICRYPLLISSYLKYLDQNSQEYQKALTAKKLLEGIAKDIEDSFAQDDEMRHLCQIQRRLVGSKFEILAPGRKCLKEGEILKHSRKEMQSRVLLLFNDVLLYCAYVLGSNNLSLRYDFDLSTVRISVPRSNPQLDEENYPFHIIGKKRSIIVVARSYEELIDWTTSIENAASEVKKKQLEIDLLSPRHFSNDEPSGVKGSENKSDKSNISDDNSSRPALELGKVAPVWIPDDTVTMCQYCKINFTKLRRRHHCRACGKVICGDCCGEAPLEYANFDPKIVCPVCFKTLISYALGGNNNTNSLNNRKNSSNIGFLTLKGVGPRRTSFLSAFKIPKNCQLDDEEEVENTDYAPRRNSTEDGIALDGYLHVYEKKAWSRYWSVLRNSGVLEFYSASKDPVCKKNIVLLSYEVKKSKYFTDQRLQNDQNYLNFAPNYYYQTNSNDKNGSTGTGNSEESLYFDLVHVNQIVTDSRKEIRYSFKAENVKAAQSWMEALNRMKIS